MNENKKNKLHGELTSNSDKRRRTGPAKDDTIRLNKFLAEAGYCSRRKADELIADGYVKVEKKVCTELGTRVERGAFITVKGDPISLENHTLYIVLNKPKNVITTTSDELGRKTVMDIVRKQVRIYPVGRLDRNTTGVLLLTNDGELAHRLTHPSYGILREYYVKLDRTLKPEDALKISEGLDLEDGRTSPCELMIHPEDTSKVAITLTEGKNHEVIRLFDAVGYDVRQLDRKMFAGITAKDLAKGQYRHLTRKEVLGLKRAVRM